jgi:hypothetical protein
MKLATILALSLLIGTSLCCTKHSLDFAKHLVVSRTPEEIEMDRHIPLHKNGLGDFHPLKIHYDTEGLNWIKNERPKMYTFMNDILVPAVVKHLSDTFRVRELQTTRISVDTCS